MESLLSQYSFVLIAVLIIYSNSVKNQRIKSFLSVLIVFLFGFLFLTSTFENPVTETEPIGLLWFVVWSLIAIGGGIYILKFPEKVLEKNAQHFDKYFSKLGGGNEFRQPYMKPFSLSLAVLFIILGIAQLYLYVPLLLSLLGN